MSAKICGVVGALLLCGLSLSSAAPKQTAVPQNLASYYDNLDDVTLDPNDEHPIHCPDGTILAFSPAGKKLNTVVGESDIVITCAAGNGRKSRQIFHAKILPNKNGEFYVIDGNLGTAFIRLGVNDSSKSKK